MQNPAMKKIIDRFETSGAVPTVDDYSDSSEPVEPTDMKDLKIQELEQRLVRS